MPNIEEHIQRAVQEGKFDDLSGKGKPLRLEDDPHADPDWQLAYHMLRESGFSLPWIELRQEIQSEIDQARLSLQRAWEFRGAAALDASKKSRAEREWQRALAAFRGQLPRLNKRIFDYNLQAPAGSFQLPPLKLERELERLQPAAGH
jgi:DnaJ family protein C protein 28